MSLDLNEIVPRKGTHSVKWEFIPAGDDGVKDKLLPFWLADMDFTCAQPILDAMKQRLDQGIFGYSLPYTDDYLSAVTGWFKKRADWDIDPEHILVTNGVVPALSILIRGLTKKGDGVIIQQPVYYPFMSLVRNNERTLVNNALIEVDGTYQIDFIDLEEKACKPESRLFIFCSPHNPVGRVWTKEELDQVADICLRHNVTIVSDEIHCDLLRPDSCYIPLSKANDDERIITCTAASKSFNLAGLQIANIIVKEERVRQLLKDEQLCKCGLFGANPLGIVATLAAYTQGEPWLKQVNTYIDDNLHYVAAFVDKHFPKARFQVPEGTYFAWIDFRDYGLSHEELEKIMIYKANVALDEGYIFGEEGRGFERINVACPRSVLEECLNRMKKGFNG